MNILAFFPFRNFRKMLSTCYEKKKKNCFTEITAFMLFCFPFPYVYNILINILLRLYFAV